MKTGTWLVVLAALLVLLFSAVILNAEEGDSRNARVSVFGAVGISGGRGEYPSDYDAKPDFSYHPGVRLRLDEIFKPSLLLLADFGYLEAGFIGYVQATDSYFWRTYQYLNLNGMIGSQSGITYYAGGLYLGIGTGAYNYYEWTDEYTSLNSNLDLGLAAEVGADLFRFLSLGVQGRFGLISIAQSVDIKNWGILAHVAIHVFRF